MKKLAVLVLFCMVASLVPVALAQSWVPVAANTPSVKSTVLTTPTPSSQPLHIVVGLKLQNVSSLGSFLQGLRGGSSTPLTHAAFVSNYSPTASQVQAVENYLTSQGFTNVQVTEDNLLVSAQGTVGQAQQAFNTPIVSFTLSGKTAYAPNGPVMVPTALGNIVLQVLGLSNANAISNKLSMQQNLSVMGFVPSIVQNPSAGTPDVTIGGLTPNNLRTAYDAANTSTGGNTVVAVVTEGDDLTQVISDLRQAELENSLPLIPVVVRQVEPVPNPQDNSGDDEWDLDSQSITGLAYNVKQLVFYNTASLDDSDTILANDAFATDDIATVGNMSYGGCEDVEDSTLADNLGSVGTNAFDEVFAEAVAQGQTWSASSGDAGAACGVVTNLATPDTGVPSSVEYPASSPNVVAVGGTSLFVDSNYNYVTELSWDAGGGGTSNLEPAPSWQFSDSAIPTSATGLRALPDVAMSAGPEGAAAEGVGSYAIVVINGADEGVVGTSWSSPLNVGAWARLESARCNSLGFEAPIVYSLDTTQEPGSTAAGFHDIIAGTNGEYSATPGWDYTTGYGSFDIAAVDAALNSAGYTAPSGCVPPNQVPAPTAALAAPATVGVAPLTVAFSGSGSTDPAGRAFTNYGLNFGDGSVAVQSTPNFSSHTYNASGTYTASLQVTNSGGAVSAPATQSVTVLGTPPGCAANGDQLIQATASEFTGTEGEDIGNGTDVVQYGSISEPASMPGELVFTIQVDNLNNVLPGFRWTYFFNIAGQNAPNVGYYYVAMVSADGPSPVFNYGYRTTNPAGFGQYQVVGTLNAASNYTTNGTITLVLDESAFGLTAGSQLTHVEVETRTSAPDDLTGTTSAGVGLTQEAAGASVPYTLVGNSTCASNAAPVALLTASATQGATPLAVSLNGSSSTAATGANVAYYQFNFGDGTSTPWQSSPTVQHNYPTPGTYMAALQVADNRGLVSSSASDVSIVALGSISLAPASLSFGDVAINLTSAVKTVTLKNTGTSALNVGSIGVMPSTNFKISANTCGATLAASKTCKVSLAFDPVALGALTASLVVTDNASGSPQSVALSGAGVEPATLSPARVTYVKQALGTTSAAKTFTLTNTQPTDLTGIAISTAGNFAVSSTTCGTSLNAKSKCTISVTFTPTATGPQTGQLSVSDSGSNSPQTSNLTGTGK
ncbi:MAG: choice-of-anchor D domain-containing protein [Terriglobales bacterium]